MAVKKHIFLIVVALAVPVIALAALSRQANELPPPKSKEDSSAARARLSSPPASLEDAKLRLRRRLADLEKMTEEEWQAERKAKSAPPARPQPRRKKPPVKWENMTPEQKLQSLGRDQRKTETRRRLPDIHMPAARPESDHIPAAPQPR